PLGREGREVDVVADRPHGRPDGGIDQPPGECCRTKGHADRLGEQRRDRHRPSARGVDAAQLGVGAEAAAGEVDRGELGLDRGGGVVEADAVGAADVDVASQRPPARGAEDGCAHRGGEGVDCGGGGGGGGGAGLAVGAGAGAAAAGADTGCDAVVACWAGAWAAVATLAAGAAWALRDGGAGAGCSGAASGSEAGSTAGAGTAGGGAAAVACAASQVAAAPAATRPVRPSEPATAPPVSRRTRASAW